MILYSNIYKNAYEIKVSRTSKNDIKNVKEEYLNIIQLLKEKIAETEELIRIKKMVKSDFAYKLSKNMLKTISNLSMEVMNLNQVSLKDHKIDTTDTMKFLEQLNTLISEKSKGI